MSIEEILHAARPNLSAGSLKTYTSIIRNIGKQMEKDLSTPEAVIADYEAILVHLQPLKPSLRKTKLACLIVFMSKTEGNETATEKFRTVMMDDKTQSEEEEKKQELTPRQEEGWIDWEEVLKLYHALELDVTRLWKKPALDKGEFHNLQTYVLMSCIVLLPVRRSTDWVEFKLRNVDEEKDNFFTYDKRKATMVFNEYKTKKTYGQQRIPIPPKLTLIIKKWIEKNPHDHLLVNYHQTGCITPTQITQNLHAFFKKPISTSLLRHIYLTHLHKGTPAIAQMAEVATNMAHSIPQQLEYVKQPIVKLGAGAEFMTESPPLVVPKRVKRPVKAPKE